MNNKKIIFLVIVFLAAFLVINFQTVSTFAGNIYKVFVNDKETTINVIVGKDGKMTVPLDFPVVEGNNKWTVEVDYNKQKNEIHIKKSHILPAKQDPTRGDITCNVCDGSGDCTICDGTGKVDEGDNRVSCSSCDGTGDCWFCNGKGSY